MKKRDGDQDLPMINRETDCQSTFLMRIMRDVPPRREVGIERYGTALQPFNGRDAMRDAWEEFLDLGQYMEQLRREREDMLDLIEDVAIDNGGTDLQDRAQDMLKRMKR